MRAREGGGEHIHPSVWTSRVILQHLESTAFSYCLFPVSGSNNMMDRSLYVGIGSSMTSWNLFMVIDHDLSVILLDAPWSCRYRVCMLFVSHMTSQHEKCKMLYLITNTFNIIHTVCTWVHSYAKTTAATGFMIMVMTVMLVVLHWICITCIIPDKNEDIVGAGSCFGGM
jgi:hypothetical protein